MPELKKLTENLQRARRRGNYKELEDALVAFYTCREQILVNGIKAVANVIDHSDGVEGLKSRLTNANGVNVSWDDLMPGEVYGRWLDDFNIALELVESEEEADEHSGDYYLEAGDELKIDLTQIISIEHKIGFEDYIGKNLPPKFLVDNSRFIIRYYNAEGLPCEFVTRKARKTKESK